MRSSAGGATGVNRSFLPVFPTARRPRLISRGCAQHTALRDADGVGRYSQIARDDIDPLIFAQGATRSFSGRALDLAQRFLECGQCHLSLLVLRGRVALVRVVVGLWHQGLEVGIAHRKSITMSPFPVIADLVGRNLPQPRAEARPVVVDLLELADTSK